MKVTVYCVDGVHVYTNVYEVTYNRSDDNSSDGMLMIRAFNADKTDIIKQDFLMGDVLSYSTFNEK